MRARTVTKLQIERACKGVRDAGYPLRKVTVYADHIEMVIGEGNDPEEDPLAAEIARDKAEIKARLHGKN
jgi:hypothetical protein